MLHSTRTTTSSTIRRAYDSSSIRSKIVRDVSANEILDKFGKDIRVYDLAGDMQFVSAELVMHEIMDYETLPSHIILNFRHVSSINHAATQQLCDLAKLLTSKDKVIIFIGMPKTFGFTNKLKSLLTDTKNWPLLDFPDLDSALEHCEEQLLAKYNWAPLTTSSPVKLEEQPICHEMSSDEIVYLENFLKRKTYESNQVICSEGELADRMFFVESGQVSVWVNVDSNRKRRLNVIKEASSFGEASLLDTKRRIADIVADKKAIISWFEPATLFQDSSKISLNIQKKLYKNLSSQTFEKLQRSDKEIRTLSK
jgi:CRP-like cAMP-binding protein/anti-anti-sigma regulatory factor